MQYFDKIEAYFEGELNDAEKARLERDLLAIPALKQEFDAYQASMVALGMMAKEEAKTAKIIPQSRFIWWAIAAGFLLLISLASFLFANTNYSNQQLANQYYQTPQLDEGVRGTQKELATATKAFLSADYTTAIQTLQNKVNLNTKEQYLLAHAYYKSQNYTAAAQVFQNLIQQNTTRKQGAEWFLALNYLKQGNIEEAQQILDGIIAQTNHPNRIKAIALKERLDNFWRKLVW